jgi:hypothetical protein
LKGILPANQNFQCGERLCLLQIGLFNKVVETHVSLEGKLSVLEAGASTTVVPLRIGINF